MSNILYMALSQDGFIAGPNGETPWSDAEQAAFKNFVTSCDVVLLGRRTYMQMKSNNEELFAGPRYYVATRQPDFDAGNCTTIAIASTDDMPKGTKVGIVGGGELNASLAKLNIIDELVLDIEPLKLEAGTKLFGSHEIPLKLELLHSSLIGEATIQRHYRIAK